MHIYSFVLTIFRLKASVRKMKITKDIFSIRPTGFFGFPFFDIQEILI